MHIKLQVIQCISFFKTTCSGVFEYKRVIFFISDSMFPRYKKIIHIWTCRWRLWGPSAVSLNHISLSYLSEPRHLGFDFAVCFPGSVRDSRSPPALPPLMYRTWLQHCPCCSLDLWFSRACRCAGCLWRCLRCVMFSCKHLDHSNYLFFNGLKSVLNRFCCSLLHSST